MKKFVSVLLSLLIICTCGCKDKKVDSSSDHSSEKDSSDNIPEYTDALDVNGDGIHDGKDFTGTKNGYFVKDGESQYTIIIPENCAKNIEYAAKELKYYVDYVADADIVIECDGKRQYSNEDKVISIGKTIYQKNSKVAEKVDYNTLKTGGYFVKNDKNVYLIDSAINEGVIYATYEFLSVFFGVEFLSETYTYIPRKKTVLSYNIDYLTIPTFPIRDYYANTVWNSGQHFGAKLRMNSPSYKATDEISGADNYSYYTYYMDDNDRTKCTHREGHTIQYLLMADAYRNGYIPSYGYATDENGASKNLPLGYFAQKKDWYAYDPQNSRSNSLGYSQEEVCYMNGLDDEGNYILQDKNVPLKEMSLATKMINICVDMVENEVSDIAKYLMLGHADFYAECKCDKCKEVRKRLGGFTGTMILFINAVTKEVKRRLKEDNCNREVKFVMFAYSKSIEAPVIRDVNGNYKPLDPRLKLNDDIIIKMAYRNCVYHSLWDESCEENETKRNDFRKWSVLGNSFAIWDYSCMFSKYLYYMPNLGAIRDNYIYYFKKGVEHVLTQGCPSEHNFYDSYIHQWVACKLLWDPYQDVNALIHRFHTLYFGEKYAGYVDLYRDLFDNYFAIRDVTVKGGHHTATEKSLDTTSPDTYSYDMLNKAANVIQEGIDKAKLDDTLTDGEREDLIIRLRSVKITPQFMIFDLGYFIDDTMKRKMAEDFFESIDLLKLTYMSEGPNEPFSDMKDQYLK